MHAASSVQNTSTSLNEMFTKKRTKDISKVIPRFYHAHHDQTLFRLDYDQQSSRRADEEELYKLLEVSVPGLVLQRERNKAEAASIGTTSRGTMDSAATGHRLLITPDAFNIVYLLPPTTSFLDRVKELLPYSLLCRV